MIPLPDRIFWCPRPWPSDGIHGEVIHGWQYLGRHRPFRCPVCERERQRERADRRRPPRPAPKGKGMCCLCAGPLPKRRRSWCSESCVNLWLIASTPRIAFYWLSQEVGSICWVCFDEPAAEVDHVRALWTLNQAERVQLRWWLPSNLQLIGKRCHKAKTKREARLRADLKRARAAA